MQNRYCLKLLICQDIADIADPQKFSNFTLEILKTLEKSHVGGWFPWGFLPSPDCLILWSVPDVCKDVDLDVLVEALKPVGTFKKIGKVFRREEDSTVGVLRIGEDVDSLLIPREVRLAGGVWRVISKPATKEAEFRERLTQFLEEEGRTLEDVARIIEKSTPHPPQPPKKPKEPRVRRRVQQMVTPPLRLVVGTYDSSNASDSEFSDFETSRQKGTKGREGSGHGRKVRKMPVSYLGSKFLGSDVESEDDEELVEAFLRRGEKQPSAPATRRRVHLPVPMFEENPGPQPSKADRWREYVSQVSWGKLKRRVKGWAPRTSPGVGEAGQALTRVERDGVPGGAGPENVGDGLEPETPPRRWKPKINWALFRRCRRQEAASTAQGTEAADNQRVEAADNQGAEAIADQGAEAASDGAEAAADQRVEAAHNQRAEAPAGQEAEALAARRAAGATPGARARKQVKTVRFQTPGRFSWFCKRRRAFWHTPRLPALPRRVPRAGEARSLRVLRAEARAEAEHREQEDPL
ncbi:Coiled-coil domain-containing protein 8 [Pteropus alecto]|uniref:Coiled-coil domain-containing protein 8 n=1 Tax=Pteropus alecto TaxID=9402 RepID=L5KMK7_PTEAL|nr:Coiled-coil domain-containing protein 8 [Pteropus alecto]